MDLTTLQAQIRASRQFTAKVDGVTFNIELPSDHAWRITIETNCDAEGRLVGSRASRATLLATITGWEGLTERHLLSSAPADPLPFSPAARSELLDTRQDIADDLMIQIGVKLAERREARDAASASAA